jgi:predicted glycosyltransferase
VEKTDQAAYEESVLKILNRYYDLLLIHSDPRLVALDETFDRLGDIRVPIHYTGFVVRPAPARRARGKERIIIASSGGGKVGVDLLEAAIKAVREIADDGLRLRTFLGPFMEESDRERLSALTGGDCRISLHSFSLDFLTELAQADLSISMAGYNTCMDILSSGVRALVHPFPQNREQALRAGKLEDLGLLGVLHDLDVSGLSSAIRTSLGRVEEKARPRLDMSGASNTAHLVEKYFVKH